MKIIFMGTPEFAVPSLEILLKNGYEISAVITVPDRPGGRLGIIESAVKKFAVANGLRVLQPEKLKNPDFLAELSALNADFQVVVAFRMLPEVVWNMPPLGTMNLHGSFLPKYRGAAPINWAIIEGEKETGLTTFLLKHEIDTGDVLFQEKISIDGDETAGELHDRMMKTGADLVLKSVKIVESGNFKLQPQNPVQATHAPKIFTETCKIDFSKTARQVHNFIRGLSPYPTAWTILDGKILKIFRASPEEKTHRIEPGLFFTDNKNYLKISTLDGFIQVLELQMEGKKRMSVKDFLNGHKLDLTPQPEP